MIYKHNGIHILTSHYYRPVASSVYDPRLNPKNVPSYIYPIAKAEIGLTIGLKDIRVTTERDAFFLSL